jgi:hypothetical protein
MGGFDSTQLTIGILLADCFLNLLGVDDNHERRLKELTKKSEFLTDTEFYLLTCCRVSWQSRVFRIDLWWLWWRLHFDLGIPVCGFVGRGKVELS